MPSVTAGTIMDNVASALLNDAAKTNYTYAVQIPHLNVALLELQEYFELNEVPVVDTHSEVLPIDAGVTSIGFEPDSPVVGVTYLPDNLIEPQYVWERNRDINPFVLMTKLNVLPRYMEGTQTNQLIWFVWESQEIRFLPSDADNDIKIDYIRNLFEPITDPDDEIVVINAQSFLQFRTGALCAEFIGENKTRADELNAFASLSMDRVVGIGTKGRQSINTRRRPFRSSFKRRTYS